MTYADIIKKNCEECSSVSWWPRYAYHYTDVTNVVGILSSGYLYSRVQADANGVMKNDNASRQVIDMTENNATSFVRFYFRPLTPTQYHNEGFKHNSIRYCGDVNANVPVPIFLLFDLEKVLSMQETCFSELSQAGHGYPTRTGVDEFAKLPFDKIYSIGASGNETLKYRHAEILYPKMFAIDGILKFILCRNECDKSTLLNMLRSYNITMYYRYKDLVKVARDNTFQRNGLFLETVVFNDNVLSFVFADSPQKRKYVDWCESHGILFERTDIRASFLFEWRNKKECLYSTMQEIMISYLDTRPVVFNNIPPISLARTLRVILTIEEKVICVFEQSLASYELV